MGKHKDASAVDISDYDLDAPELPKPIDDSAMLSGS
jgi:hypothetical protein